MKFPTVRLIDREVYKVIYGGEKCTFVKGVEYTNIHPSFSAHLATLKDGGKNLFNVDSEPKIVKIKFETDISAINKYELLMKKERKKARLMKTEGWSTGKIKPHKLSKRKKKKIDNHGGIL